jgi:hypothetical protein
MWGGDDWGAVRYATKLKDGLSEGRFSAYWLQELLFNGKILPVINNLWSFAGLSLAGEKSKKQGLCPCFSVMPSRSVYTVNCARIGIYIKEAYYLPYMD